MWVIVRMMKGMGSVIRDGIRIVGVYIGESIRVKVNSEGGLK